MRFRRKKVVLTASEMEKLDPTSSLQKHFMCVCECKFAKKASLAKHINTCSGSKHTLVCSWCNLKFKNKGNLVMHCQYMHGERRVATRQLPDKITFKCEACDAVFSEQLLLRYHIRRMHYNLKANPPPLEDKKINQIWFERVLNTNLVMKMTKIGANTLVMKPLEPSPKLQIPEVKTTGDIDLSALYPTGRRTKEEECKICHKMFKKIDLKKHHDEKHLKNFKMKCNNCNRMFKRLYIYLQHVCSEPGKRKPRPDVAGVRQYRNTAIHIENVASLQPVQVD